MSRGTTDYQAGDEPVPVGTTVEYFGSGPNGLYTVHEHRDPNEHPDISLIIPPGTPEREMEEYYPDGVAYHLWPKGQPKKLDVASMRWVRRTSFRVADPQS